MPLVQQLTLLAKLREKTFSNRVLDYSQTEIKKFSVLVCLLGQQLKHYSGTVPNYHGTAGGDQGTVVAIWAMSKIIGKSRTGRQCLCCYSEYPADRSSGYSSKQSVAQRLVDKLNSVTRESLTEIRGRRNTMLKLSG